MAYKKKSSARGSKSKSSYSVRSKKSGSGRKSRGGKSRQQTVRIVIEQAASSAGASNTVSTPARKAVF